LIVKIFRNNTFAGSTVCLADGTFNLHIDLFEGRNDLLARQYDVANQASPDSNIVTVFYVPETVEHELPGNEPSPPTSPPGGDTVGTAVANFQLVIDYDYTAQGIFIGKPFKLPITFSGGVPPYAVSVEWGDGASDLYSRQNSERFIAKHVYDAAGYQIVVVKVSDKEGNTAALQFVMVVNGPNSSPVVRQLFGSQLLFEYWPLVVLPSMAGGLVLGVFLGILARRRREKRQHPENAQFPQQMQ
jgi:hypothetical protein